MAGLKELYEQVGGLIDAHEEILIFGHKDADGDTLGCSLAFAEALRLRSKRVYVVIPPPLPEKYGWMPGFDEIREEPPVGSDVDLVLGAYERLSAEGIAARVVSLPSMELFARQPEEYRDAVLPPAVPARLAVAIDRRFLVGRPPPLAQRMKVMRLYRPAHDDITPMMIDGLYSEYMGLRY